nr:uncharacterized protein CI109_004281 [Kwoniella shandongensis]KAA5527463.1 hypothetical protein CI109_004281 [Kwoniella shandongensis]
MSSSQSSSSSSSSSILPQAAHSSDSPTIHHARHLSSNPQPNPHSEPSNSPVNITLSLPNPPSLHPTIRFTLYPHLESSITERECVKPEIWITITLPDEIFVDPDELSGKWGVSGPSTSIGSRAYVEVKDDDDDEDESKGSANKVQVQSFGGGHRSGRPREQGRMNSEVVWWNVDPSKVDVERPSRGLWTSEDPDPSPPLHTLNMVLRLSPSSLWSTDMESMQQPHDIRDSVEGGQISEWTTDIDVPLHARYLAPSEEGKREIVFPISRRGDIKAGWICVDDKGG